MTECRCQGKGICYVCFQTSVAKICDKLAEIAGCSTFVIVARLPERPDEESVTWYGVGEPNEKERLNTLADFRQRICGTSQSPDDLPIMTSLKDESKNDRIVHIVRVALQP